MMAAADVFEDLAEFEEEEIREIRILFAIDPQYPGGPERLLDYLAENELTILKKVLQSMNETRFRMKMKEQRNRNMFCCRCGKPLRRTARAKA